MDRVSDVARLELNGYVVEVLLQVTDSGDTELAVDGCGRVRVEGRSEIGLDLQRSETF